MNKEKIKVFRCAICYQYITKAHLQRHLLRHRDKFPQLMKELERLEKIFFIEEKRN